jgi:molybdopterin-containing oxidoreductase family membrane subunit
LLPDAHVSGANGIVVWGNNRPVGWAWDVTNFVFLDRLIGHAGTLISAILFLFRQKWRTSTQPVR